MALRWALLCFALLVLPAHVVGQQPYNDWEKAYAAAGELVNTWTRDEIANITVYNGIAPGHAAFTPKDGMTQNHPISSDFLHKLTPIGPMGVNGGRGVSGWVAAQTLAASWDTALIGKQYAAMAREFRNKGYSMQLGPVTGPMGRSPLGGRNFESFVSPPISESGLARIECLSLLVLLSIWIVLTSSVGPRSVSRWQNVRYTLPRKHCWQNVLIDVT